ncbi:MAG TPA: hypothetical protein PLG27_08890, partial [Candidatus Latescibacteria bacterium]|nr:hypothetical protein [Candidatus Latescibacterota bacterium]
MRLLLSFLTVALFAPAAHSINVSGTISTNTTWTKANSPYVVTGPITVATGVTLTIEAGVVVYFGGWYP